MNPIRLLREQAGLTQAVLAERAGTSQPTIAAYESGMKSPTLETLSRIADSLGFELAISVVARMTREDHRSLAYHREIVRKLAASPDSVLKKARVSTRKLLERNPNAAPLLRRWRKWLDMPLDELFAAMLDPGTAARDMRQVSPFSGLLSPAERTKILRRFQKEYRA